MSDGKAFVADLISGRLDIHDTGRQSVFGASFAATPGSANVELGRRLQQLARLEAGFNADPQAILRRFRRFYDDTLTLDDVRGWIGTYRFAFTKPELFQAEIDSGRPSFGVGDWFERLRAYVHAPPDTSAIDQDLIDELCTHYRLDADVGAAIKPNVRKFETLDPAWIPLALDKLDEISGRWPDGLAPFRRHSTTESYRYGGATNVHVQNFVYGDDVRSRIALFSDFGTGYYHSAAIARQLFNWRYPYAFHLGDVYYGGTENEFAENFRPQLAPLSKVTELFCLPENHELYSGGQPYWNYIDELRSSNRTRQQGSYFVVELDHHQIIAVDVNWNGRQTFTDDKSREWLRDVLARTGDRTNILLTGSCPYDYGKEGREPLLGHLWDFVRDGMIQMWFWGDVHYCALYPRDPELAPFIGGCIGHGGYPGKRIKRGGPCWAPPTWVEDEPRFPTWTNLRQDMTNNGWVELSLKPDGGVALLYVDWLGAKRFAIEFTREGRALVAKSQKEFSGRDLPVPGPELHLPPR